MSLADLASLGSFVSAIAVTASIIYLALQTHQNAKHTRALIQQGYAARTATVLVGIADADLTEAWIVGNGGTPTREAVKGLQFEYLCTAYVNAMLDLYNQRRDGLLNEDLFRSACVGFALRLRQSGYREFWNGWKAARPDSNARFKAFVDEMASKAAAEASASKDTQLPYGGRRVGFRADD